MVVMKKKFLIIIALFTFGISGCKNQSDIAKIDTKNWNCTDSALSFTNYDTYNSGCMYEITEISIRK